MSVASLMKNSQSSHFVELSVKLALGSTVKRVNAVQSLKELM